MERVPTHDIVGVIKGKRSVAKPVLEREGSFTKVVLCEHILIPDDEFEGAELVCTGEVEGKVKGGILGVVCRVEGTLGNGSLLAGVEDRDDDKTGIDMSGCGPGFVWGTYGSLKPFLSLATRSEQPMTWTRRTTTGSSPCTGVKLREPLAALTGRRAAVLRARLNFVDMVEKRKGI